MPITYQLTTTHPGHSANYSEGCLLLEQRPPIGRTKCGAFGYQAALLDPLTPHRPGQLIVPMAGVAPWSYEHTAAGALQTEREDMMLPDRCVAVAPHTLPL